MRTKLLLHVLLFFSCLSLFPQNLQFYREDLNFEIKDQYFYVSGIYFFCNTSDKEIKQVLVYPFPKDSLAYGEVDSVSIVNPENNSLVNIIKKKPDEIYFPVVVKPYKTSKYKIFYRQKILNHRAEYILITTHAWHKPFEIVNYNLRFPIDVRIDSITYQPDSIINTKNYIMFKWQKKDFMPDKNLLIWFNLNKLSSTK